MDQGRRIRLLIDFEGPFDSVTSVGWQVLSAGEEIGTGTGWPSLLGPADREVALSYACTDLVRRLDAETPEQLALF